MRKHVPSITGSKADRGVLSRLRASEDGVTIIELLIAMTIFAIVASGVAVGMTSAFGLTRNNRNRSVAANLAAKEMDVVRSTEFESLPLTTQNKTETVDSVIYAITRTTSWVSKDGTSGGACSPPAGTALAFLKVVVAVTWPNMQGVEPVTTETILAPPIGSYDSDTGHLAVRLRDRDGAALNGQVVTVVGPGGTFQISTTNGCAFFLSLTPGNFTVSVNSVNYVNGQGLQNPSQVIAVTAGSITSAEFDYDQKATQTLNLVGLTSYGVPSGLGARVANTSLTLGNLLIPATSGSSCTALPTTITSSADASITQGGGADTNFGTSTTYGTYSDDSLDTRALVKFTLPTAPSGCSLSAATLRLYNNYTSSGRTINVLQGNASWTETGVTWNNQPATTGSAVAATSPSSQGWMTWGVTSIVSAQYSGTNNGFLVRDNNEGSDNTWVGFDPRESTNDPELVLTWVGGGGGGGCTASPTTVTSSADASITQGSGADTNSGTSSTFGTYSDDSLDTRGVVKFTLPTAPSGCSLSTATLRLYNNFVTSGRTINVLQANASWTETGVTWNNQPATTGSAVGATTPSSQGWMTWGVTTIVTAQYAGTNNGFSIRDNNEGSNNVWVGFDPRELSNDPELVLTWTAAPSCPAATLNSTEDSTTRENLGDNNYGGDTTMDVQSTTNLDPNDNRRAWVKFTLPTTPSGCTLTDATLRLYASTVYAGRTIQAYRVNASWTENVIDWWDNTATTGTAATSASLSSAGWQTWSVLSIVQAQYTGTNHGFMLRDSSESAGSTVRVQSYRTSEHSTTTNRPELVLTYTADAITLPTVQTLTATPLFPYSNGYQAWGGECLDADPQGVNPSGGQPYYAGAQREAAIASNPNQTTVANVTLKSVDVFVKLANDSPVAGVNVEAYHDPDAGCPSGTTLVLGTTAVDGYVHVALPYGTWRFQVVGRTAVGSWPAPLLSPLVANPQAVTVTVN